MINRKLSSKYLIYTDGLKRVDSVESNNKNMVTSNAVFNQLSYKSAIQTQNSNATYLNANGNKYLIITRTEGFNISYFRTSSFLIVDDTGTEVYLLSFGRGDSGAITKLVKLAGTQYLSIINATDGYTAVLETSATWNKMYTIYGLAGYRPNISASATNPFA